MWPDAAFTKTALLRTLCGAAVAVAALAPAAAEGPAGAPVGLLDAVRAAGDDPSPALRWKGEPLASRPALPSSDQLVETDPAIRVHVSRGVASADGDADLDGVPDRGRVVLVAARDALALADRMGLGGPADDGDAELDVYVLPLDGAVRGYAALERADVPRRGASGFVVVDGSAGWTTQELRAITARSVARLVLAAHDADAPVWWTEPTAVWIESQVAGTPFDADRLLVTRWNNAETGLVTSDPLLSRGNVGLLWALGDERVAERAVASTWQRLATRPLGTPAATAIASGLAETTGLDLADLVMRGATAQVVGGAPPERWSIDVAELPLLRGAAAFPVAPLGAALVQLAPDPVEPVGTILELSSADGAWRARLLAERHDGGWEMAAVEAPGDEPLSLTVPWTDYRRAVAVLVRDGSAETPGRIAVEARRAGPGGPFALSSFAGRPTPAGTVEIGWTSAFERELFGWLVERAPGPDGPFVLVQELPVPALGLPREGTSYTLVDPTSPDDGPVYYRVVGVTTRGLRVSGPVFTVR